MAIGAPTAARKLLGVKLPNAALAWIGREKLERYLLDPDHPTGGPKASFFLAVGFARAAPEILERGLLDVAISGEVAETVPVEHGIKYVVDGEIESPGGRLVGLRTVSGRGSTTIRNGLPGRVSAR